MLDEALEEYKKSGAYPFHMPGHKRKWTGADPYAIDITEIEGFDDLHHPEGLIKEAETLAASLYGAKRAFLLVNGSTAGNLAAVYAAVPQGGVLLLSRNSHKSVYHAAVLRAAKTCYLWPRAYAVPGDEDSSAGRREDHKSSGSAGFVSFAGSVTPTDVAAAFAKEPSIAAVIITSPTYEGVVSDIAAIAEICHTHGAALLVDAAHGAHLGAWSAAASRGGSCAGSAAQLDNFAQNPEGGALRFPPSQVTQGADAVVVSLHKTLPSLTQTALLLLPEGSRLSEERVAQALDIFQTSSPSYVLMASIVRCLRFLRDNAAAEYARYAAELADFYREAASLKALSVLPAEAAGDKMRSDDGRHTVSGREAIRRDPSKILISTANTGLSGKALADILRKEYGIETELSSFSYVLALSTVMDGAADLQRLSEALRKIDRTLTADAVGGKPRESLCGGVPDVPQDKQEDQAREKPQGSEPDDTDIEICLPIHEALAAEAEAVPLTEAENRIAADFAGIYPPGVPLLVPGERISKAACDTLRAAESAGLTVTGVEHGFISVVSTRHSG